MSSRCLFTLLSILLTSVVRAEPLEIIELPAEDLQPAAQLSLNWDCDVLLLTTSQRYRPGSCARDDDDAAVVKELPIEQVPLESADHSQPRRKLRQ